MSDNRSPDFDPILSGKRLIASQELLNLALDQVSKNNLAGARSLLVRIKAYGAYKEIASFGISICEAVSGDFDLAKQELNESQLGRPSNLCLPANAVSVFPNLDSDQFLWAIYLFLLLQPSDESEEGFQPISSFIQSKLSESADQKLTSLLDALSPVAKIRIGKVYNPQIIGNFSNSTDIYLRKLQLAPSQENIDIFLAENPPINPQLMKMFRRKMQIVEDSFLLNIYENSGCFKQSAYYLPMLTNYSNEYEIFNKTKPSIGFTDEEDACGKKYLEQLGILSSDWFVCLFSRDSAFKKSQYPSYSFVTENFRDSDINKFSKAITFIIDQGGFVVRMGSVVAQELELKHPRLIDYPNLPLRNEFLDVYLAAKCRFLLGTTSGICDLSYIFDVPNLRVNFIPPGGAPWGKESLYIPKKIRSLFTGRLITYPHLIDQFKEASLTMWNGLMQHESLGYVYEENSEEEILEATKEMLQRLEGAFVETDAERTLQKKYQDLFLPGHWSYGNKTPIGRDFLKRNQDLFRQDIPTGSPMNILVILPKYSDDPFEYFDFPVGLAYISATLKHHGYHVDVMNLNEYYVPLNTNNWAPLEMLLRRQCATTKYDIVCTGGLSPFFDIVNAIVSKIRLIDSDIVTIIGGGLVSSEPAIIMEAIRANFGVIGEGEETIVELVGSLRNSQPPSEIKGIVYLDSSGRAVVTPPRPAIEDIDSLPFPDYEGFNIAKIMASILPADLHGYYSSDEPRIIPIVTSRSCPFRCTFCFHPIGNKYRQRSIDSVMSEIEYLIATYNINTIMILDELFGYNKKWLMEFCEQISVFGIKWGAQMHLSQADEDQLAMMRNAGCIYLSYGLESASNIVLKSMKKQLSVEQMEKGLEATYKAGIQIQGNFIFGDSAETVETLNETLNWWANNRKYMINLSRVIPFPGSELWHRAVSSGIIKDKLSHIVNACGALYYVNLSQLNQTQFKQLFYHLGFISDKIDRLPGKLISCTQTGFNSQKGALYHITVVCPHCQSVNDYDNIHNAHIKNLLGNFHSRYGCKKCNQRFDMLLPTIEATISKAINECKAKRIAIVGANQRAEMLLIGSQVLKESTVSIINDGSFNSNESHFANVPLVSATDNIENIASSIDTIMLTYDCINDDIKRLVSHLAQYGIEECRPFAEIDGSLLSVNLIQEHKQRAQLVFDNFQRGIYYSEQNRHSEAFKLFVDIANLAPHDVETHVRLASSALALGDYQTALNALYTADMLLPGNPEICKSIFDVIDSYQSAA